MNGFASCLSPQRGPVYATDNRTVPAPRGEGARPICRGSGKRPVEDCIRRRSAGSRCLDSCARDPCACCALPADSPVPVTNETATDREIVNTDEERDGFNIARAIAVSEVAPDRIFLRDAKAYCAVLLDDNNRKPIIRLNLNLNGKNVKFVITFEHGKDAGIRRDIESMVDIYRAAAEPIRQTIRQYEDRSAASQPCALGGRGPVE
jgi:hypothetical protein